MNSFNARCEIPATVEIALPRRVGVVQLLQILVSALQPARQPS